MRRRDQGKLLLSFLVIILCGALVLGIMYVIRQKDVMSDYTSEISEDDEDNVQYLEFGDNVYFYRNEITTYLVMGTDNTGNLSGEDDAYEGNPADFLMLLVVDPTEHSYALLQINRDTIVDVPVIQEDGTDNASVEQQICLAHCYGRNREESCKNVVTCISNLLGGLEIDGYYEIDANHIGDINHLVGGVPVTLEDDFTKQDPAMEKGKTIVLNDKQAEIFVRGRMEVGDGTNVSRMNRQMQYLKAYMEIVKEKMKEDASFINDAYRTLNDYSTTNISQKKLSKIAMEYMDAEFLGVFELEGESKVEASQWDELEHVRFYPDETSVVDVMTKLFKLQKEE